MSRRFQRTGGTGGGASTSPKIDGATGTYGNFTTRPQAGHGKLITPGNNALGTYTQLISGAANTTGITGIELYFHDGNTSTAARDMLSTLGIDAAGGTTYTPLISNLLTSCAGNYVNNSGIYYYFPLAIASGTSVGIASSVNNATVGTIRCSEQLIHTPVEQGKVGSAVETVGAVTATSKGTDVTPGQAADGTWVLLGTITNASWYFQLGIGVNNGTLTGLSFHSDLAWSTDAGATKNLLIEDMRTINQTTETLGFINPTVGRCRQLVPAGAELYGRMQCSGVPETGYSMAAYALR